MGSLALASAFQAPNGGFLPAPTKTSTALKVARKGEVTMNTPPAVRKKVRVRARARCLSTLPRFGSGFGPGMTSETDARSRRGRRGGPETAGLLACLGMGIGNRPLGRPPIPPYTIDETNPPRPNQSIDPSNRPYRW